MKDLELLSVGAWAAFDHIFRMNKYPSEGETIQMDMELSDAQAVHFGDCSANIAFVAAKLGVKSALASIVGIDFFSSGYQIHLEREGVNLEGLTIVKNKLCGHNYIFFDSAGSGFCISHLGAAEKQETLRVPKKVITRCKNIVINEKFSSYTLEAAITAKKNGARVFLNGMVDTADNLISDFLYSADVLFINESEFRRLCLGIGGEDKLFKKYMLKLVFVTMGRRGCHILFPNQCEEIPIVEAKKQVDFTGAGDSFTAGTISAIIRNFAPLEAAKVGATVSSFIIEDWGCQTRAPTWQEMDTRLKKRFIGVE